MIFSGRKTWAWLTASYPLTDAEKHDKATVTRESSCIMEPAGGTEEAKRRVRNGGGGGGGGGGWRCMGLCLPHLHHDMSVHRRLPVCAALSSKPTSCFVYE